MLLKWGVAGAGKISSDFVYALKNLSQDEHKVLAVAARSKERADSFEKIHGIPLLIALMKNLQLTLVLVNNNF